MLLFKWQTGNVRIPGKIKSVTESGPLIYETFFIIRYDTVGY